MKLVIEIHGREQNFSIVGCIILMPLQLVIQL